MAIAIARAAFLGEPSLADWRDVDSRTPPPPQLPQHDQAREAPEEIEHPTVRYAADVTATFMPERCIDSGVSFGDWPRAMPTRTVLAVTLRDQLHGSVGEASTR